MKGAQTFSASSDAYASFRPQYPPELFAWIADQCPRHDRAWDCATGNGQAALGLAQHFELVEATDVSPQQIEHVFPAPNVRYSIQSAEETNFARDSFDVVTVAQALHWFDFNLFWPEVRRTARPDAFFCAWGYAWFECDPELKTYFMDPLLKLLEPYWAKENGIMWRGYRSEELRFPFRRIEPPPFAIHLRWDIQALISHARTWSALKQAKAHAEIAPSIARIEEQALERFGSAGPFELKTPLEIVAGRILPSA